MGPLASARRRVDVEARVRSSVADGARVASGGRRPASPVRGYFYEPTVLTGVTPQMPIAQEEICGPVATVIGYQDEAEAVRFANDGFGLAATVWTGDPQRGLDIAGGPASAPSASTCTSRTSARRGAAAARAAAASRTAPRAWTPT